MDAFWIELKRGLCHVMTANKYKLVTFAMDIKGTFTTRQVQVPWDQARWAMWKAIPFSFCCTPGANLSSKQMLRETRGPSHVATPLPRLAQPISYGRSDKLAFISFLGALREVSLFPGYTGFFYFLSPSHKDL